MTTTKITLLVPTGIKRIKWIKDTQYYSWKTVWWKRIQINRGEHILTDPIFPEGKTFTRFFVGDVGIHIDYIRWQEMLLPEEIEEYLITNNLIPRYSGIEIEDLSATNRGCRDIILKSKLLEKMYERESTTAVRP